MFIKIIKIFQLNCIVINLTHSKKEATGVGAALCQVLHKTAWFSSSRNSSAAFHQHAQHTLPWAPCS